VKGIIFNLLEEVVSNDFGVDSWDDTLDAAGLSGAYTAIGNYADSDFIALLAGLPNEVGDERSRLQWFGRRAMPLLAQRYSVFFSPHASAIPFLVSLNDVIHAEVRKLYPGAEVPDFEIGAVGPASVTLHYRSQRRLCWLAEGFILGAADYYEQGVSIDQTACMHLGDDHCTLVCTLDEGRNA
jgi:hypothetical protein